jgi:hypothetical protein
MSQEVPVRKPVVDWLTVAAIAAIAISFTVAFHEGAHALACLAVGGNLQEYSALYAECESSTVLQRKIVAGTAPIYNLLAGTLLWVVLRNSQKQTSGTQLFLWLFMFMNWCYGACYFIFSGVTNIGDWAVVLDGWEPGWLWRLLITIVGTLLYIIIIRLSFQELAKMIGGEAGEQNLRAKKICTLSYVTSFGVVLMAGFFCPYGLLGLPVTAGLTAVLGSLSPLIWLMRWYRIENFAKLTKEPLEIHRSWQWITASAFVLFAYTFILGRTLYF